MMEFYLTIVLAVFATLYSSQACQMSIEVTHNKSIRTYYISENNGSLTVQAGDSVTVECPQDPQMYLESTLWQDEESINHPHTFNVTGKSLAVTNTVYTCVCKNRAQKKSTSKIIIRTVELPPSEYSRFINC